MVPRFYLDLTNRNGQLMRNCNSVAGVHNADLIVVKRYHYVGNKLNINLLKVRNFYKTEEEGK